MPRCFLILSALALLLGAAGCVSSAPQPPDPSGGNALRDLPRAVDANPDPHVFEFDLTAAPMQYEFVPGKPTTVLAYNGSFPGPLIECNQGDELVVHFTNQLAEPTTVHWHGVRVPANMDGSHLSQEPVPPGGTFTYRFTVPDAALFWYHPHHMGQDQLYRGLYGPLLVHAADEPRFTRERVVVLSDISLDAQGQVVAPMDLVMSQRERAMGVEGNTLLVNGQIRPQAVERPGGRERWRILNAATGRYFDLRLPDRSLHVIGSDGGALNAPVSLAHLLLSPGERADVAVDAPTTAGPAVALETLGYQRLLLVPPPPASLPLLDLACAGATAATPALPSGQGREPVLIPTLPDRMFVLNARLVPVPDSPAGGMPGMGQADFLINGHTYPDVPSFTVPRGAVETWVIENHSQMDHPFHVHGMRFQVLDTDGAAPPYGGWRDTVNIPTSLAGPTHTRLLVDFDGHPGEWVYHCHILFHQEQGMMASFVVQ